MALARELGPEGVRVKAACPGTLESPMMQQIARRLAVIEDISPAEVARRYECGNALRRRASADEVASVCLFPSPSPASFANGRFR